MNVILIILRGLYGLAAFGMITIFVITIVKPKRDAFIEWDQFLGNPILPLLFFLLGTGLIAWKGIPKLVEKRRVEQAKNQKKSGGFESTGESNYCIYEDDEKYVFGFVLRKANSPFLKTVKGRFVEITDTALTISAPYPLYGRKQKQQSLHLYEQGTWRKTAKIYDRSKITGVRMYTHQIEKDQRNISKNPNGDHAAYIVAFDYGNAAVDLNYFWGRDGLFKTTWSQFHEQHGLTVHKAFTHALNVLRPYNPTRTIDEDMSVSGGLPEADDMVSRILAREEKEKKQKDDDMPDPF